MRESRRLGGIGCLICLSLGRWHGEQLACLRDVVGAGAIGEQTVVTNAMEAGGQHMDEEATDELIGCERHCFVPIASFDPIVFPLESDALVVERDQSPVGDGDAVGVARQIAQHLFGSAEWAFAVHHPFTVAQWCQERGEVLRVGKRGMPVEEL